MILVVDDSRENVFSMMQLLQMNGFTAEAAYSGEEALKKILKNNYSLIILDVQMPGMDGFEVAENLSGFSKTRDTPIIFLSAVNTDKKFVTRGYATGVFDYIVKPFDADILLLKIKAFNRLYNQTQELNKTQQSLLQEIEISKKAEAKKDAFMAIASHELKTPLTSLKGYVQFLEAYHNGMDKKSISQYLANAGKQVQKLNLLISELLDITKIENGKIRYNIKPFNFQEMLISTINVMREINTDCRIILSGNADVTINGDPLRIEQVITNYISNAIKYSPESREVHLYTEYRNNMVKVVVTDTGIGIPADKQSLIFEKFFRVEEDSELFQGMGIGLYICADIIKRHNGQYGVTSAPGKGSSFYFTVPVTNNTEI